MITTLIITSIAGSENEVLQQFASGCAKHHITFILVGDVKSPSEVVLEQCLFFDYKSQLSSEFVLAKHLPIHHYARKNLGYLLAIKNGATCIIESDDDNAPLENFWQQPESFIDGCLAPQENWINPYAYFGCESIYPRGYDLQAKKWQDFSQLDTCKKWYSPIQQTLSNGAPDIDAITRLKQPQDFYFQNRVPLVLPANSYCTFNSQNTRWFEASFPLLYLPSTCSFRATDIWRSLIAKRIMDENNMYLSFHAANVFQKRNAHDIYEDLDLEAENIMCSGTITNKLKLLKLKPGTDQIALNLLICYEMMVTNRFLESQELNLVKAWLKDLENCTNRS